MSGVRGPNSALTEFLRSQGINANEIRRRHERRQRLREEEEAAADNEPGSEQSEDASPQEVQNASDDPEIMRIAQVAARKRRGNFDDLDDAQAANEGTAVCAICNSRFTLTVYSKPAPGSKDGYLCRVCSAKTVQEAKAAARARKGVNKGNASKKRKALAADLLQLRFLTPPSLQDMCINLVAKHIDSIEELGECTVSSFNKISRILGKNRRLTPKTMQLFLRKDVTTLEFWDCSNLTPEAFNLIPALCPNLERLVLGMCGQLNCENMSRLSQLKHLKDLHLDGPFMVRKDAWLDFFDAKGVDLTSLTITSVYRIDSEVLALLTETCVNLEKISLHRLCQMYDPTPFFLLGSLPRLKHLEIREMETEAWSDEAIVHILNSVGSQLETLVIGGAGASLSDRVVEAIAASCGNLHCLELESLTEITDEAVVGMFTHWSQANSNTGLQKLSLQRCFNLGDGAVQAAMKHSGATLVELNINSLRLVGEKTLEQLVELANLTKLDIGFIGRVYPAQIYKLSTSKTLRQVLAFGNIRLSGMPLPTGLTVVGTM